MTARRVTITKLEGAQNDFILIDGLAQRMNGLGREWPRMAAAVCDRASALGADGLLVLERSLRADVRMRIFNPDGSEPSMCGNGIRCLAWHVHRHHLKARHFSIETAAGIKYAEVVGDHRVRVNMGLPRFLKCVSLSMVRHQELGGGTHADLIDSGVPHLVCWVKKVDLVDVDRLGRALRRDRRFRPHGTNVDFVEQRSAQARYDKSLQAVVHAYRLRMRTYERGVEHETKACGTGAVAAAAALVHAWMPLATSLGRESDVIRSIVDVRLPGGTLQVRLSAKYLFDHDRLIFGNAFLEGPVRQLSRHTLTWTGRSFS